MKYSSVVFSFGFSLVGFVFLACGSDDNGGGGGTGMDASATEASIDTLCNASCLRSCRCNSPQDCPSADTPKPACVSECVSENRARASRIREAWVKSQITCLQAGLSSGRNDCYGNPCATRYIEADPAYPNIPVVQKCLRIAAELTDTSSTPSKNCADGPHVTPECNGLASLTEAARQAADSACLSGGKTCKTLEECLEDAQGE